MNKPKKTAPKLRPNKYGVAPKAARTVDNVVFASKLEADRYALLKIMQKAGKIKDLELQPSFILLNAFTTRWGEKINPLIYKADFRYTMPDGNVIVEDTKRDATKTKEYLIKRKLLFWAYPLINFFEVANANAIGGLHGPTKRREIAVCGGHDGDFQEEGPPGGLALD